MTTKTAVSSTDFLNSFGVDTHIDYTDGSYASIGKVVSALDYLGLDHVRDASPVPSSDPFGQGHLGDAAAAGVKFTFLAQGGENPADVVARLHDFVAQHPGSISAIEGPNEVNNWPVTYNGLTGTAGAQAYQQALYSAVHADPLLHDVPVLGFTDYPFHASVSDLNNIHPYTNSGDQPRESILSNLGQQLAVDPGKSFMITEMGYQTALGAPGGSEAVDQATQAKLTLNALMDSADIGSTRTFLYELLDEQPDPSQQDQQAHFGLFNFDGSPKLAATALHNLTSILSDPGAGGASGSLDFDFVGMPSDGHSLLTTKSDGSYQIIAWNEPDLWDQNADHAIAPAATTVKLALGQTFQHVDVFDPLVGTNPVASYSSVSSLDLSLDGHALVIQVSDPSGAAPAVPATTPTATTDAGAPDAPHVPTDVPTTPTSVVSVDTSSASSPTDVNAPSSSADPVQPAVSADDPSAQTSARSTDTAFPPPSPAEASTTDVNASTSTTGSTHAVTSGDQASQSPTSVSGSETSDPSSPPHVADPAQVSPSQSAAADLIQPVSSEGNEQQAAPVGAADPADPGVSAADHPKNTSTSCGGRHGSQDHEDQHSRHVDHYPDFMHDIQSADATAPFIVHHHWGF